MLAKSVDQTAFVLKKLFANFFALYFVNKFMLISFILNFKQLQWFLFLKMLHDVEWSLAYPTPYPHF